MRDYMTVELVNSDVIASNLAFMAKDPDGFLFGVISSKMFMAWQKAIGGRIKSDPRFSGTYSYNSFPLPGVSDAQRTAIVEAGAGVRDARAIFVGSTLATLYDPLAMPPTLLKAHQKLDKAVDKVFGSRTGYETLHERQKVLFRHYSKLTEPIANHENQTNM